MAQFEMSPINQSPLPKTWYHYLTVEVTQVPRV